MESPDYVAGKPSKILEVLDTMVISLEAVRELDILAYIPFQARTDAFVKGYMAMFGILAAAIDYPRINPVDFEAPVGMPLDDLRGVITYLVTAQGFGKLRPIEASDLDAHISACGGPDLAILYALDCIVDTTRKSDLFYGLSCDPIMAAEWEALPPCANDADFDLVRHRPGPNADHEWGLYSKGHHEVAVDTRAVGVGRVPWCVASVERSSGTAKGKAQNVGQKKVSVTHQIAFVCRP